MIKLLDILYPISVSLFVIFFISKLIIYVILDKRNGHSLKYGSVWGYENFLPYDKEVMKEDEKLKKVCNYLHRMSMIFLVVFIIAFSLRYFVNITNLFC